VFRKHDVVNGVEDLVHMVENPHLPIERKVQVGQVSVIRRGRGKRKFVRLEVSNGFVRRVPNPATGKAAWQWRGTCDCPLAREIAHD
jgi:hypothetical protein